MYKKKRIIENFVLKKGKKNKSENLIKKLFKLAQKTLKNQKSLCVLKSYILKTAKSIVEAKQTLKRGKKKKIIETQVILLTEKKIYSNAWANLLNVVEPNKLKVTKGFPKKVLETLSSDKTFYKNSSSLKNKKSEIKFRW